MPFPINETKTRLVKTLTIFDKEIVQPRISDIKWSLFFQIVFHVVLVFFGILVNLAPTIYTVIGSVVLGGSGVGANLSRLRKNIDLFIKDRRSLKTIVGYFHAQLQICAHDDATGLKKIEAELRAQIANLKPKEPKF